MSKKKTFSFEELDEDAQQKALERFYDINVEYDWWEPEVTYFSEVHLPETRGVRFSASVLLGGKGKSTQRGKLSFDLSYRSELSFGTYPELVDSRKLLTSPKLRHILKSIPGVYFELDGWDGKFDFGDNLELTDLIELHLQLRASTPEKRAAIELELLQEGLQTEDPRDFFNALVEQAEEILNDQLENETLGEELQKDVETELLSSLRKEYEYLTSEEAIRETIMANEYKFTKDGELV